MWPVFDQEEINAVSQVLRSGRVNYWTGEETRAFEREFATYTGSQYGIALANGTVALEASLRALSVGPGDEIIVTPRTFLASASSIVACGATPVFADVDLKSQNITAESVAPLISSHTKAIICVHLAGWPCEMDQFVDLAKSKGLHLIEDCAQAHGAKFRGRSVGSWGDIGAWSFCQDKILTTGGEGGMVTTSNREFWSSMWSYKDHGKSWDAVYNRQHAPGFRWLHESFGTNWRMTEMQGAIGRIQLQRLPVWHELRKMNALTLAEGLKNVSGLRIPLPPPHIDHAWYKFYAFIKPHALKAGWHRDRIMSEINQQGVPCFSGSCSEIYKEKAFQNKSLYPQNQLPNARNLGEASLMFLVDPTIDGEQEQQTIEAVHKVMARATR